jgi:hypothetical protein
MDEGLQQLDRDIDPSRTLRHGRRIAKARRDVLVLRIISGKTIVGLGDELLRIIRRQRWRWMMVTGSSWGG